LNAELRELRDNSVALEEAVQGNLSQYWLHSFKMSYSMFYSQF
jgi:hypothetical protein